MQVWPLELQKRILQITCVQTNMTSIEKALNGVLALNDNIHIHPQQIKAISKMANCDMSAALNILRTIPRVRDKALSKDLACKDLADTNLFHRFGKIMYNKSSSVLIRKEVCS